MITEQEATERMTDAVFAIEEVRLHMGRLGARNIARMAWAEMKAIAQEDGKRREAEAFPCDYDGSEWATTTDRTVLENDPSLIESWGQKT